MWTEGENASKTLNENEITRLDRLEHFQLPAISQEFSFFTFGVSVLLVMFSCQDRGMPSHAIGALSVRRFSFPRARSFPRAIKFTVCHVVYIRCCAKRDIIVERRSEILPRWNLKCLKIGWNYVNLRLQTRVHDRCQTIYLISSLCLAVLFRNTSRYKIWYTWYLMSSHVERVISWFRA